MLTFKQKVALCIESVLVVDVFHAAIGELAEEIGRQVERVREACGALNAIESTVTSADGLISVTVGSQGQVRDIKLNARVYRRLSPSELADALVRQIDRAVAAVSEQRRRIMEPLMPEGLCYDQVAGENVTLDALLPPRVEPKA